MDKKSFREQLVDMAKDLYRTYAGRGEIVQHLMSEVNKIPDLKAMLWNDFLLKACDEAVRRAEYDLRRGNYASVPKKGEVSKPRFGNIGLERVARGLLDTWTEGQKNYPVNGKPLAVAEIEYCIQRGRVEQANAASRMRYGKCDEELGLAAKAANSSAVYVSEALRGEEVAAIMSKHGINPEPKYGNIDSMEFLEG